MQGNLFCPHRTKDDLDPGLVNDLLALEAKCGFPFKVNRGVACPVCNAKVGGAKHSAHMKESHVMKKGRAVDIAISDSHQRFVIIKNAMEMGFKRIEDRGNWVHLDKGTLADGFVQEVLFNV